MRQFSPRKNSLRLARYNYHSSGCYFITICTHGRFCWFGEIDSGNMVLNLMGQMVQRVWQALPAKFPQIQLDSLIIMPNHLHSVLYLHNGQNVDDNDGVGEALVASLDDSIKGNLSQDGQPQGLPLRENLSIGNVIGAFKSITTVQAIEEIRDQGWPPFEKRLWQRNYYDHIIRNEKDLQKIRQYIQDNPSNWVQDTLNPAIIKQNPVIIRQATIERATTMVAPTKDNSVGEALVASRIPTHDWELEALLR